MPKRHREISDTNKEKILQALLDSSFVSSYTCHNKNNEEKNQNKDTRKKTKSKTNLKNLKKEKLKNLKNKEYKKEKIYILTGTKESIYQKYINKNENGVSGKTFYSYIPDNFKKAKKSTDMCPMCTKEKIMIRKIERLY